MARKPTGNPNGRPQKEIDRQEFEKLCGLQCTLEEIAGWFGVSEDTIERWVKRECGASFADTYKKYSGKGKIALRRYQMHLAKKNAAMAIWLGKQYLGQKDSLDVKAESEANDKVTMTINFKDYKDGHQR